MSTRNVSSRQRMLAALGGKRLDHGPCSFMLFNALKNGCRDYTEFIERQVAMGLDPYVEIPPRPPVVVNDYYNLHGLPVSYDPRVTTREWVERPAGEVSPILVKEYLTPAGILRAEVRQTDDWRWGEHVPFLDDYLAPRSRRFIISGERDLDALRFLLVPPSAAEVTEYHVTAQDALALARKHDLLTAGGWGVGADLIAWIYGLESMVFTAHDRPAWLAELLEIIATWNRSRMELVLSAGVDLYIKRAWYENLDFWSPRTWKQFIFPNLRDDVRLAHERGARFGYLITANCMALLPMIAEAGVDAVIGVDPRAWDLAKSKAILGGRTCLWGGVNGHLTVENGTPDQVRSEVQEALRLLDPDGGFILSPVDNVREATPIAMRNVDILIDEWRLRTAR